MVHRFIYGYFDCPLGSILLDKMALHTNGTAIPGIVEGRNKMSVKFYKNEVWGHEEMSVKIYGNVVGEVRPDGSQWVHMKDYDTLRAENKLHCAELTALRAELINLGEHLAEIGYANATLAEIPEIIKDRLRDNANCARKLAKANAVCEALYLKDVSWWSDVDTAISAWRASTAAPQPPDAKEEG